MPRIPSIAILALISACALGCEETIDSAPAAQQQGGGIPLDIAPSTGNSALGGAMRAAERTEDKINDYQERLNRQMDGE